jgi:hypothetical protein
MIVNKFVINVICVVEPTLDNYGISQTSTMTASMIVQTVASEVTAMNSNSYPYALSTSLTYESANENLAIDNYYLYDSSVTCTLGGISTVCNPCLDTAQFISTCGDGYGNNLQIAKPDGFTIANFASVELVVVGFLNPPTALSTMTLAPNAFGLSANSDQI